MQTTPSGLQFEDTLVGSGQAAKSGDTVEVHYTGSLDDGTIFDSSVQRAPFTFHLDMGEVIAGWDEGVTGMQIGGKRSLVIPSNLGYGTAGAGGVIPPNATLHFDIELLKIL
ncbi:MAG: FKBP-type peptidyl-prolyl cis-trans isomerase [Candidatus Kerfeldbacteria bacterium]|nr:FKBP-type peptidyl-prolyl cis-trans isomerase [Candidatus Kerfeldbacteria bacterium]